MKNILLLCLLVAPFLIIAQPAALKTKSYSVAFKLKNLGLAVNGSFKIGSIVIKYDEKNPAASSFVGTVAVSSINTGIDLRDKHLLEKEEFFQPKNFAEIKMESKSIAEVNGKMMATFNLNMKGITKTVVAPLIVIANKDGSKAFSTTFTINRRDWKVGNKSMMMGDKIDITVNALATK